MRARRIQELLESGHSKQDILDLRRDIAARLGITDEDPLAPVADHVPSNPHVQPFTIDLLPDGSPDPRTALRGQQGLRACGPLPALSFVGVYQCYCCPSEVYHLLMTSPPEDYPGGVLDWVMALESYCLDDMEMDVEEVCNKRGKWCCTLSAYFCPYGAAAFSCHVQSCDACQC